jgi:hypothetical protein
MPSTSKKQHNFMAAVANNPAFAKKAGVPQSIGKEFESADKGKKFGSGGSQTRADRQVVNQPKTDHGAEALFKKGGSMASKMNPGFMAMMAKKKDAKPSAMGKPTMKAGMDMAKDGMKKPTPMADMAGMKKGGMPMKMKDGKKVPAFMNKGSAAKKMAMGGSASSRADGVATKGKTKGKMLNKGGMAKGKC